MKRRLWIPAALVVAGTAVTIPFVASASSVDTKLQIGVNLHFTGPDSSAGTFVAAGAVRDSGSIVVTDLKLVPQGNQDDARLTGTQAFSGQQGSFVATFKGLAGPLSDEHQAGKGTFEITGGTGAYAGIKGQGTFTVVVDFSTNQIIGTQEGQAK